MRNRPKFGGTRFADPIVGIRRRRKMITRLAARIAVCAAAVVGSSWGAIAAEKVSVRLNWIPGTEHSYFYLGKEKGWYAEAGIDLEILAGQGSTVSVKTV